jgi:hypothetical protein
VLIVLMAVGNVWAADPWIGTWNFVSGRQVSDSGPQITMTFQPNGMRFMRTNASGTEEWAAKLDSHDYLLSKKFSSSLYNQVVLDRIDKGLVQFTTKNDGKVIGKLRLSGNGKEMVAVGITNDNIGPPTLWIRSGGPLDPAQPLSGLWKRNFDKELSTLPQFSITIESSGDGGIRYSSGSMVISAKFDGKEYAVQPDTLPWKTASVKRIDPNTIELEMKGTEGRAQMNRISISADGRQMTLMGKGVGPGAGNRSSESKYQKQ